jgi:RNA polymerase sigma-70 factor (ECF subfamily)
MDSDERLLERFLEGEEQAFEELVRRHEAPMRGLAYGFVRDRGLAEDIAQDSFLRAYRKARSFRGQGAVRSWLYRIVVNRAQDELRRIKRKREVQWEAAESVCDRSAGSTDELLAARELGRLMAEALAGMRNEHRTPLLLRDVQGMTYSEIARFLDWPLGTVQARIHRGRLEVRAFMKERCGGKP